MPIETLASLGGSGNTGFAEDCKTFTPLLESDFQDRDETIAYETVDIRRLSKTTTGDRTLMQATENLPRSGDRPFLLVRI